MVLGDRRKFLSALIMLDPETIVSFASEIGSDAADLPSAARCERIRTYLEDRIDAVNVTLAPYESVRRFAVLGEGLSVENGTLTPTLKLKRRVIQDVFSATIDELYSSE